MQKEKPAFGENVKNQEMIFSRSLFSGVSGNTIVNDPGHIFPIFNMLFGPSVIKCILLCLHLGKS